MKEISDAQWELVAPLLPKQLNGKGGRPRASDRMVLNGVLYLLQSGSQWNQLPQKYGSYATCWRRYQEWEKTGLWEKLWLSLLPSFERREQVEWMVALWEGNFVPKKRDRE